MKIAIVGAGVVGVTTAYELARGGHEVTVFERRSSAAEEASYAPGALAGPALLAPWALAGAMGSASPFGKSTGIEVGSAARMAELRWLWHWRASARSAAHLVEAPASLKALAALSQLSQRRFEATVESLELTLESSAGALLLLRDERTAAPLQATVDALRSAGVMLSEMDAQSTRNIEPGLAQTEAFAMALHVPGAFAVNCRQFTVLLRQAAQRLGVAFEFQTSVRALRATGGRPEVWVARTSATDSSGFMGSTGPKKTPTAKGEEATPRTFEAVVMCNGVDANDLLGTLGVRLGMVALWGTSLTAPLREDVGQPQGTVIDVARQVSLSRIGQRIRVAGGAELGRASAESHESTLKRLYSALDTWFPGSAARGAAMQVWRGARAVRRGGMPAVGASGVPGVLLNLAHGDTGWALASGCAQMLATVMGGEESPMGTVAMQHFGVKPPA